MTEKTGKKKSAGRSRVSIRTLNEFEAGHSPDSGADYPAVISSAAGARVKDADGNRYIDMTSFFGVAVVGHRNSRVLAGVRKSCGHLVHAMGDFIPDVTRASLLKNLAALMPESGYRGLLSLNGSDAVETALKCAATATGRSGVISFEGAYHGLSAGALEVTHRQDLRAPFEHMLSGRAVFAPWPAQDGSDMQAILENIERMAVSPVSNRFGHDIGRPGALIVEPIQGRGGVRVPPPGFLSALADICRNHGLVFVNDEIYCGSWRTGTFLTSEPEKIVPDIVCLGKGLGGGFPISVAMMRPGTAQALERNGGEALHTSTFMGWPVSCAAALEVIGFMQKSQPGALAARIESKVFDAAEEWKRKFPFVKGVRGRGAMLGVAIGPVELEPGLIIPASRINLQIIRQALETGVILLPEGEDANVMAIMPPLIISDSDLDRGLKNIGLAMERIAGDLK